MARQAAMIFVAIVRFTHSPHFYVALGRAASWLRLSILKTTFLHIKAAPLLEFVE